MHRLDRDTSGLLVVARSDEAHTRLAGARSGVASWSGVTWLSSRADRARARAGSRRRSAGTAEDRTRHSLDTATPREAVTQFELVEVLAAHALLEVRLETGRTHRSASTWRRSASRSRAIPVYGVAGDLGLERQFLHAARLTFEHPFTGERIETESPLPDDLAAALEQAKSLEQPSL